MFEIELNVNLPAPWKQKTFFAKRVGYINFLVGANGSGKSQFSEQLKIHFNSHGLKCRVLSADRLYGLSFGSKTIGHGNSHLVASQNDYYEGFNKRHFLYYKEGSEYLDTGVDAFVLLEEKLDLKIKIEAILSQVFNRDIRLEWDSGKLIPKAYHISQGVEYELKQECHGIKELLVLLTHLYDDSHKVLIIDEPELNLHPQYQAFLLEQIRKVAGDPSKGKKLIFLITHSPFILDFKNIDDVKSVICFHANFDVPSMLRCTEIEEEKIKSIIPRLNVHHKQLFFAESPVFVEGIFDAQFIKAVQERRGVSIEGSGSCIIDVGGNESLTSYYLLAKSLGKKSFFIYDLDSLFFLNQFRINAENSDEVSSFLTELGIGDNFKNAWGVLSKTLQEIIFVVKEFKTSKYCEYIQSISPSDAGRSKKELYSILIYMIYYEQEASQFIKLERMNLARSQLRNLADSLVNSNIFLLREGAMENYYPSYDGGKFHISEEHKKKCLEQEIDWLSFNLGDDFDLLSRYGDLYKIISDLPSRAAIDFKKVIESNLRDLIHQIQKGLAEEKISSQEMLPSYLGKSWGSFQRIIEIKDLNIKTQEFTIVLKNLWDFGEQSILIKKAQNYANSSFLS